MGPFEKSRLDQELKLIGEYGLRNKREVWRVKLSLAKIRKRARDLLTLPEKDGRRLFEGNALLRRLVRIGVLDEGRMKLDYVLGQSRRFLGAPSSDASLQAGTRQVDPPRACADPTGTSGYVNSSSTSRRSSFVWILRSTSTSVRTHRTVAVGPVVSSDRT